MPDAVLFDIDGTLIDRNALHVAAWVEVFAEAGRTIDAGAVAAQIGKGGDNLVPTLAPDADEALREAIDDMHGALFKARYLDRAKPFPRARDLLARVHAGGVKVVLASSASAEELDHYVGLLDAAGLIDAKTSIDDVETSKPAPDIFGAALKKAGVAADRAIVIGDTPYDADAARKLGIATIGLLSGGFAEAELRAAGAATIYPGVAALLADYERSPLGAR